MYKSVAGVIDNILRLLGCKTINSQFMLSYVLIFLLAAVSAISLYMSMAINPETINVAGRQRMLSQRIAKEAMLVAAGVEQRAALEKTISLFEKSHKQIVDGDPDVGMNALSNAETLTQMKHVDSLWKAYKALILKHIEEDSPATLQQLQKQSPVVLKQMNKAVMMMTAEANSTTQTQLLISFVCILMILVFVVLGRVFGLRMLMDNIERLRNRMSEVGKGDFSHRFDVVHIDNEVGHMFDSYNRMLDHVSELLKKVQLVAANTERHIDNVAQATNSTEQGVSRQYADIELVATAMTEMAATVNEVSSNTSEAEKAAISTGEQAREGGLVVGRSQTQAIEMKEMLQQTAALIESLKQQSLEVGEFTSVINDVAEQTNLLALNAAIEAARAGEQGRGFAVVADEVRNLAMRTQQSTQQIQQIIQQLQERAEEAVSSMEVNNSLAEASIELAESAAIALDGIISSAETISSMNMMISTATDQQSAVANDIDQRVVNISDIAGHTKDDAQQVVVAINEVRNEAQALNQLTQQFHLRDQQR